MIWTARLRHASLTAGIALACFGAGAASEVAAETWEDAGADAFSTVALDRDSIIHVEGIPHTVAAWLRYRFATAVDCSPPRGCYASSQRNYVIASCHTGTIRHVQRRMMDLNDRVVAQTDLGGWEYFPPPGGLDSLVLVRLCFHYRDRYPNWSRLPPYPLVRE